ncbi:hypothetical protein MLD38_011614 [Melastoma candidum]|uniref:Uncharacterized protein n=1 Tax=Melastoma candidum TaxID=119954 RepID=A0ACB9R4R5_9MYRT|nr:hypothetical protein MLD38_011614 [Melastoma candidum]
MESARFSDARFVLRPSYSTLSDPVRRGSFDGGIGMGRQYPRVVDSVSCRQMYLQSYTFSRKETVPEKIKRYIGEVKKRVLGGRSGFRSRRIRAKDEEVPCSVMFPAVRRVLTCTARINVADSDVGRYL